MPPQKLVLGTRMERTVQTALGDPLRRDQFAAACPGCAGPLCPQNGWEGANVIFGSWVHPLMMGLEEN